MKLRMHFTILLCCLILSTFAYANGNENLSIQDGVITGVVDTSYGYQLRVNMPIPEERRSSVKQLKMESIFLTQENVEKLLQGTAFGGLKEDKWTYQGTDGTETTFLFQEEEMKYTVPRWNKQAHPLDKDATDALMAANTTVQQIMGGLNLSYEYPFYCVANAFSTLDTQSNPLGLENGQDVADYLLSSQVSNGQELYRYYDTIFKAFDDDYIFVFVRLQADGIPFAYGDVPSGTQVNNGVFAQFQLTSNDQITYADAGNLQTVVAEAEEMRPILTWEECLAQLCTYSQGTLTEIQSATLIRTELCYAINQRHVTYPVWEFTIEINYSSNEFPYEVYPFTFYVDAISGECLS